MAEPTLFRFLLWLYPPRFRREYGAEVLAAMQSRLDELYAGGPRRLALALVLVRDVTFSLPRAWLTHGLGSQVQIVRLPDEDSNLMGNLASDVRYAFRRLIRTPGTAFIAVLAVALGIGLTATMFSIVNGMILRGLPFEQSHELMVMMRMNPSEGPSRLVGRIHDYEDIVERQTTFDGIAAMDMQSTFNVSPPDAEPEFLAGVYTTANLFEILGDAPQLGRTFTEKDEIPEAPPVAVIGHRYWQERLGSDPDVVGTTVRVNGTDATILGVMPEGFGFPFNQQLWQPLQVNALEMERGRGPAVIFVGRLADGVSAQQGQGDIERIMGQLAEEHPDTNAGMTMLSRPYVNEIIGYQIPALLYTMLGAVAMVLVIACANVANLLLARASRRTREVAISSALGASRQRVFFQLLSEAFIIAVVGSALGIGIAKVGIDQFNGIMQSTFGGFGGIPFWFSVALDPRVIGFTVVLTIAASLLSGVIPAAKASGTNPNDVLKDGSRGGGSLSIGRLSRMLVLVEVAASCALLVGAGLMIKTVTNYLTEEYAFESAGLFTTVVTLPVEGYSDSDARRRFVDELGPVLRSLPGVEDASLASDAPVLGFTNGRFAIEGKVYQQSRDYPSTRINMVDDRYFSALGANVVVGRDFTAADTSDNQAVMIVNQEFAEQHFPGESPIGKRVALRGTSQAGVSERNDDLYYTIVGVAPTLYLESQFFVMGPGAVYVPLAQRPTSALTLIARVNGDDPLTITRPLREALAQIDPDLPLTGTTTMDAALTNSFAFLNVFAGLFIIFGAAALFLATIGLYGVLSFSVAQRSHEVGLRVALGATPADVRKLVLGQGFKQLALGLVIGLLLAFGLGSGISVMLYQVSPTDPVVMGGIVLVLLVVGLIACYVPARRATRIDPLDAMRAE
jgi:predicted permease